MEEIRGRPEMGEERTKKARGRGMLERWHLPLLQRTRVGSQGLQGSSQASVIPGPGDLTPSSDLHWHHAHAWCRYIHAGKDKTTKYNFKLFKKKRCTIPINLPGA